MLLAPSRLLLPVALLGVVSGQTPGERDMEDESVALAYHGVHFVNNCFEHHEWKGSCDIRKNLSWTSASDWSARCDPWAAWRDPSRSDYDPSFVMVNKSTEANDDGDVWECPEKYLSPSGCGDFIEDSREQVCDERTHLEFEHTTKWRDVSERMFLRAEEPTIAQKHTCVAHPIFYDNKHTAGKRIPALTSRHRERWAKFGEYEFLPQQRWMHNMEHGAVGFIYDPCLDEESKCLMRNFILKWERRMAETRGHKFRWFMTPFKNLPRRMALVSWSEMLITRAFNQVEMDQFVERTYRHAWEDIAVDGPYDYLWVDINQQKTECSAEVLAKAEAAARTDPAQWTYNNQQLLLEELKVKVEQLDAKNEALEERLTERHSVTGISLGAVGICLGVVSLCGLFVIERHSSSQRQLQQQEGIELNQC